MKKIVLASACILALASPTAFAQKAQPGDGASSQGNVGPGASQDATKGNTGTRFINFPGPAAVPAPEVLASPPGEGLLLAPVVPWFIK